MEEPMLKPFLSKLIQRQDLTRSEAEEATNIIMTGQATQAQIGGYLIALRMKGETVEEITGSAQAMRAQASRIQLSVNGEAVLDTAGTGGDGRHTFNISTAAAFVIAGAGERVAKHGNRAASSRCGSADVLAALGLNLELAPEQVKTCIEEVGIGFLFAPKFHPAMKHAVGPRRELGHRTIFNLLGPLTNPAGATHQIIGVYDPALTQPLAQVLGELGGRAAIVFHGHGGLDELTTSGPNHISYLKDGRVTNFELDAAGLGLRPATLDDLRGGEPAENARMLRSVLSGEDRSPRRDVVLLNAAAALAIACETSLSVETDVSMVSRFSGNGDFRDSLASAEESLDSGAALMKLDALIDMSRSLSVQQ
jgi:anthranilate phosphoribosyltransferase